MIDILQCPECGIPLNQDGPWRFCYNPNCSLALGGQLFDGVNADRPANPLPLPDNTRAAADNTLGKPPEWPPPFGGLPVAAERWEHGENFSVGSYEVIGFAERAAFENLGQAFRDFGMTVVEAVAGLQWFTAMMDTLAPLMPSERERDRARSKTDVKQKRREVAHDKAHFGGGPHITDKVRTVRQRSARRLR